MLMETKGHDGVARRIVVEVLRRIRKLVPRVESITAKRIVIGLGYTAVELNTGHIGLCYTLQSERGSGGGMLSRRAGTLAGSKIMEVAGFARSWDLRESVLGVAALNALSQIAIESRPEAYVISRGNAADHIHLKKGDIVAVIGNMQPMVKQVRSKVKRVYVLEKNPERRKKGILPDTACSEILPEADVVIITGSSIANGTVDQLLQLSRGAREVALVGASASILPDPLFERGVTLVSGVKVLDVEKMLKVVSEGGGTRALKSAADFINIRPTKTPSASGRTIFEA